MEDKKEDKKLFRDKKTVLRLIAVIVLAAVGASGIAIGIGGLLTTGKGVKTVEAHDGAVGCAPELVFTYELGVSGMSSTAEYKALRNIYTEKTTYYYRLFHPTLSFSDTVNLASLNSSPNTEIVLPAELCSSLEKAASDPGRNIFLAPAFAYYETLWSSSYDEDAATWDPARNTQMRSFYDALIPFVGSDEHVSLEFRGDGKVVLRVSDEYLAFAEERGIEAFVDFCWMKNAYIVDLLADGLVSLGYRHGAIASKDGFARNFDSSDTRYVSGFYIEKDGKTVSAGGLVYGSGVAFCSLRRFALDGFEENFCYTYRDGTVVSRYIGVSDLLPHDASGPATAFSTRLGCSDLLLRLLPLYMSDRCREFGGDGEAGLVYLDGDSVSCIPSDGCEYRP